MINNNKKDSTIMFEHDDGRFGHFSNESSQSSDQEEKMAKIEFPNFRILEDVVLAKTNRGYLPEGKDLIPAKWD